MEQQTANWDHCLQHAAFSHVGLRRANNQDALAVVIAGSQEIFQSRGHLFMVADGMGAHAAGELASKLATDTVALTYPKLLHLSPPEAIRTAVHDANEQIHSRGRASPDFRGMGTTSTVLLLLPQGALLAHVGDSRAYRLRGNRFEQLTFDHSLVWEMRAAGRIPDEEIPNCVPKNVITRSLGPNPAVEIDLEGPFPVELGDTFVLCSDGLSGPVEDEEIGAIVASMSPADAAGALVDLANLRGGPDNITVIVVRVTGLQVARTAAAEPDSSVSPSTARPVNPLIWTLLGVSGLAAAGLAAMQLWVTALVCLIGAVIAVVMALIQRYGGPATGFRFDGHPLGKGPYTVCNCAADAVFVDRLTEIVQQLRDAAAKENWALDWDHFNRLHGRADAARQVGKHAEAIFEYFQAIRFMMARARVV